MEYKIDLSMLEGDERKKVSRQIQEICFKLNIYWGSGSKEVKLTDRPWMRVNERGIVVGFCESKLWKNYQLITPQDFIAKYGKAEVNNIVNCSVDFTAIGGSTRKDRISTVINILEGAGFHSNATRNVNHEYIPVWGDYIKEYGFADNGRYSSPAIPYQDFIDMYGNYFDTLPAKVAEEVKKKRPGEWVLVKDLTGSKIDPTQTIAQSKMIEADNRAMTKLEQEYYDKHHQPAPEPDPIVFIGENMMSYRIGGEYK